MPKIMPMAGLWNTKIHQKLAEAEKDIQENKVRPAKDVFKELDIKYNIKYIKNGGNKHEKFD